jgi:hypothetical protein
MDDNATVDLKVLLSPFGLGVCAKTLGDQLVHKDGRVGVSPGTVENWRCGYRLPSVWFLAQIKALHEQFSIEKEVLRQAEIIEKKNRRVR